MCVSTFSALHMNLNNLISSSFGGFGGQWQLPILAVEGGSAGVGRSRQAGDSWCDHTGSARNIHLLTEGNVDIAFLLPLCWETILLKFFQGRTYHSVSAWIISHSGTLSFQGSRNFYELLLWVM